MDSTELTRFQQIASGIIDSHAHLLKEFYADDQELVIERTKATNVKQIINPGVDLKSIPELVKLAEAQDNIFIGLGLHPHHANEWNENSAQTIKNYINHKKVVAIGECGLDFFYNNSPPEEQIFAFKEQLKIALQFDKPIIIHCRDAWDELFSILSQEGKGSRGVLHCFTGNQDVVNRFMSLGADLDFYISFSGIVTFAKSTEIQAAARIVDNTKLLVETDCPFLAPHPVRGKRNEPAYIWFTVEKLAQLRNQTLAEVADLCSDNARRLFGLANM